MDTVEQVERRPWVLRRWPAVAGVAMAAFAAWGMESGADVAPIVTASAFLYLGAAALQRRTAAWPMFAVSFVAVGLGSNVEGFNATWVMLAFAAVLAVYGVIRGALRPPWGLPLQAAALIVLAAAALIAVDANQTVAGVLVAAGLLIHAGWDTYHHRTHRVVAQSMSEFCAVLDTLLALAVLVVTFG
ncbi:hypothetical protein [Kribbella capetownensis]|uniref:hypothetical protein n=1 Tax=Kribbella capetownensis TaxID=1572659 RepID=UPI00192D32B2|nr:hypothetical protein [Kribbella capetownensis]